ncbi:MAG: hypothetical protein IJT88_02470, partial [Kiritimatiellae bacterium]|nr:hypothetical protein [Kiritimatiellia bacterium]
PQIRAPYRHTPEYYRRRRAQARAEAEYVCKTFHFGLGGDLATATAELVVGGAWILIRSICQLGIHALQSHQAKQRRAAMTRQMAKIHLPTPDALEARWHRTRRKSLKEALRLGAMLMLIADTTSNTIQLDQNGKLVGRGTGLKGWLKAYCPTIPYSTATRYKRLAEQLLLLLSIRGEGAGAAMAWVLPEDALAQPVPRNRHGEAAAIAKVRACVGKLLEFHPSQRSLGKVLRRELRHAGKIG